VCVVTGHEAPAVADALRGLRVEIAHNPDFPTGMASSLRVGLCALGDEHDAVLVLLGDMPRVRSEHVLRLVEAFERAGRDRICIPVHRGLRGNPVLWPARDLSTLGALQGDVGGRGLLEAAAGRVVPVEMPDDGVLLDVDSPHDLHQLAREERQT
jgi:molybdenum cofactor cytidylyltransferase